MISNLIGCSTRMLGWFDTHQSGRGVKVRMSGRSRPGFVPIDGMCDRLLPETTGVASSIPPGLATNQASGVELRAGGSHHRLSTWLGRPNG